MFSFFSKQKKAFGLDISDTSLRLMQLESSGSGFFPSAFSEVKMPAGLVHDEQIQNSEKIAKLIEQSRLRPAFGRIESSYVVFCVPESKSFVRVINVPKMTQAEAVEAVPFEAEQYIPVPLEQVYMDFKILPDVPHGETDKMKVMICATPKSLVNQYLEVIKRAGLKPVAVEVESEAVARALVDHRLADEPTLILDMDTNHTSLIIYDNGSLQFTSSLPVGGSSLTSQLAQKLTISPDEAEKIKKQSGLMPGKNSSLVREAVQPVLNSLVEAIMNTINFYREHSEGSGREIRRIQLTSGASKLRGLTDFLSAQLGKIDSGKVSRIVQLGDPWVNVLSKPITKMPPISKNDSVSFATAIGLALRGVDME